MVCEHDLHLEQGEAGAEAAADAAAERDPRVGAGRVARGSARGGTRRARGRGRGGGGAGRSTGLMSTPAGSSQPPISSGAVQVRPTAGMTGRSRSDSLIDGVEVGVVPPPASLGEQPLEHGGVRTSRSRVQRQRGRGGLVAGEQQGHQLVAQLARRSAARPSSSRAASSSERMSSPLAAVGLGAARADLLVDEPVGRGASALKRPQGLRGRGCAELVSCRASTRAAAGGGVEQAPQRRADPLAPLRRRRARRRRAG